MAKDYASSSYKKGRKKKPLKSRKEKKPLQKKLPLKKPKSKSKPKAKKKSQVKRKSDSQPQFPWRRTVLFIIFIIIVVVIITILRSQYLKSHPAINDQRPMTAKTAAVSVPSPDVSVPADHKVDFVFQADNMPAPTSSSIYMLQLGTFDPASEDLAVLQAQLQKLHVHYQTVQFKRNHQLMARLQMGPYKGLDAVEAMWQQLYVDKIYAVVRELQ